MLPVGARRITPAEAVAVDEYNAAQHPAVIDPRLVVALGKERPQPSLDLLVGQPKYVTNPGLPAEPESDNNTHINGLRP